MNRLCLMRHAKAVPPEHEDAPDRERPLEPRGRRAAQAVAEWVAEHRLAPALVLSSPSLRTRQTLDIVYPSFDPPPPIHLEERLYLASAGQLLARLRQLHPDARSALLVGHNPGFHELAVYLSDIGTGSLMARLGGFPTGALAVFETELPWSALDRRQARLTEVVIPKELQRGLD